MKLSAASLSRLRAALDKKTTQTPKIAEVSLYDDDTTTELQSEMQDELEASETGFDLQLAEERRKQKYNETIELMADRLGDPEVLSHKFGHDDWEAYERPGGGRASGGEGKVTLTIMAKVSNVVLPTPDEETKYGEFATLDLLLETIMQNNLAKGEWNRNADIAIFIKEAIANHFNEADSTEIDQDNCVVVLKSNTPNNDASLFDDGTIEEPGTSDLIFEINADIIASFRGRSRY